MGRFNSQLRQVLTTYTTRPFAIILPLLGMAMLLVPLIGGLENTSDALRIAKTALSLVGFPAFVLPTYLVLHAKAQFAHPRAVLMPSFLLPHLAIPATILFTLMFALPVLIAEWTNCDPLGLSAFACALAVSMIWGIHTNRMVGYVVALGVIVSAAMSDDVLQGWSLPNNDLVVVRLLIVLAGLTASAAWLWRLTQLREEMEDYETTFIWRSDKPSRVESVASRRLVAHRYSRNRLAAAVVDWWNAQRRDGDRDSFRGRMRLLEYGLSAWPAELSSLVFAAVILAFGILGGELMSYSMRRILHFQLGIVLLGALSVMPWAKFLYHRPQMVGELMFPMTRVQLIDGLFATVARQVAAMWIAGYAAALLVVTVYPHGTMTLPVVGTLLLFSASLAVIIFGLGAYFATWSSRLLQIFVFGLCFGPIFGLFCLWAWLGEQVGTAPIIILTLLQLFVGQGFIRFARRKWLNLELG